ncbi:MAG: sulfatase-like hydrolase/transferase, partial [Planctomycetota bacterium]
MDRHLRTLVGLLATMLASSSATARTHDGSVESVTVRPNVVLVIVDDMGPVDWQHHPEFNPLGSRVYETPNMLRLAQRGVTFSNGYAASPVCSPSRAAIMTGKSAAHIGITDYIGSPSNAVGSRVGDSQTWIENMPASEVLLPEALRAAGYATGFFGKWHLGEAGNPAADPLQSGFDVNVGGTNAGNPQFAGGFFAGADGAWFGMPGLSTLSAYPADAYLSDALSAEAASFIRNRASADEPFLAVVSLYVVHTPIQAPASLVSYYANKIGGLTPGEVDGHGDATYAAMVHKMDEALGRVLDALDDPDADGIPDAMDNCPTVFNPIRPVDGGAQ